MILLLSGTKIALAADAPCVKGLKPDNAVEMIQYISIIYKQRMSVTQFTKDKLNVSVFDGTDEMAVAAAVSVSQRLQKAVEQKNKANLILATGASQFGFLKHLQQQEIEWDKVKVFHLDEYKNLPESHPASFRKYLKERILDAVKPYEVHFLNGDASDIDAEMTRYEELLKTNPVDVACIGIGENGHIAFNDPPVADFNDPKWVKAVALDEDCRNQQLGEGWFSTFNEVPTYALTLTIPAIMSCKTISCVVPDGRKANAVYHALHKPITTKCPATILRKHPDAALYLDKYSASKILKTD
jgi:glucosamine-6-phosphate deaminase